MPPALKKFLSDIWSLLRPVVIHAIVCGTAIGILVVLSLFVRYAGHAVPEYKGTLANFELFEPILFYFFALLLGADLVLQLIIAIIKGAEEHWKEK